MKSSPFRALSLIFLVTLSGACMPLSLNPFKKEVILMSPLEGTLLKGGKPLKNMEIKVKILMPSGEERWSEHITNEKGEFRLPLVKDTMTLGPMIEFAVSQYAYVMDGENQINFWHAGKQSPDLHGEFQFEPAELEGLTCDINDEPTTDGLDEEGAIITLCKWKSIRRI